MKKIIILFCFFAITILPQVSNGVKQQILLSKDRLAQYWLWNAITGTNLVTETDVFTYGSFSRTLTTKDSGGTKTASKYIVIHSDYSGQELITGGGIRNVMAFGDPLTGCDYGLLDAGDWYSQYGYFCQIGSTNNYYFRADLSDGTQYENQPIFTLQDNTVYQLYVKFLTAAYTISSINDSTILGINNCVVADVNDGVFKKHFILYPRLNANRDTLITFMVKDDQSITGTNLNFNLNFDARTNSSLDSWIIDPPDNYGRNAYIDSLSLKEYGYLDSSRTLAKITETSELVEDFEYTYYASVLQPNGRYSKGADSLFQTTFPRPIIKDQEADTNLVIFTVSDESILDVVDTFFIYRDGVLHDTSLTGTTITDSITEGHWYRVLGKATYSSRWAVVFSSGIDSLYLEPIIPYIPEFEKADNLIVISDTTGNKLIWFDGTEDVIIQRKLPALEVWTSLDTVLKGNEIYCDSIPTLTANTTYLYRVASFDGVDFQYSNVDTGYTIFAVESFTVDSSIASIDTTGGDNSILRLDGSSLTSWTVTKGAADSVAVWSAGGNPTSNIHFVFGGASSNIRIDRTIDTTSKVWLKADIYIPDALTFTGSQNGDLLGLFNGTTLVAAMDGRTSGTNMITSWRGYMNGTTQVTDLGSAGFGRNAWKTVIMYYNTRPADGSEILKIYVGGANLLTNRSNATFTNKTVNTIRFGGGWGTNPDANDYWKIDNIVLASDSANLYTTISIDTTWSYDTTYTLVAFDCGYEEPIDETQVQNLHLVSAGNADATIRWNSVPNVTGYKIERKVSTGSEATFSQIATITGLADSADYTNLGDNVSNWTLTFGGTNEVTLQSTGGNPSNYLNWDYKGDGSGRLYLATSSTAVAPFPYSGTFWINADVYISANFPIADSIPGTSRLLTLFSTGTTTALAVLNLYSQTGGPTIADTWRMQVTGLSDRYSQNGFSTGNWINYKIGVDFVNDWVRFYADDVLIGNFSGAFTGTSITGIRLGTNGTTTIPSASDYWGYDNIRIATDSVGLFGTSGTPDTTYYDSPLSASTTYTYRVRGYNDTGNLTYSDTLRVTTQSLIVLPPTNLDTTLVAENYARFSFTPSLTAGVDSTIILWNQQGSFTQTRIAIPAIQDTFGIYGLVKVTNYEVRLQAKENTGNTYSTSTATLTWQTDDDPTPPPVVVYPPATFVNTAFDTTHISYSFTASATVGVDTYYVYIKKSTDLNYDSTYLASPIISSPFTLSGKSPSTQYLAYMKAKHNGVFSNPTSTVSVTTNALWTPPAIGYNYYFSVTGIGSNPAAPNGTINNPFTLAEAILNVPNGTAGNEIRVKGFPGTYTYTNISFNKQYVIWEGTITAQGLWDEDGVFDDTQNTVFVDMQTSGFGTNLGGSSHSTFRKIIFYKGTGGRGLLSVGSPVYLTIDSCNVQHHINNGASNDHSTRISGGNHITFKNTHFVRGTRTGIWVMKSDFFTMENCYLTGHSNHPPIQIMPNTNSTDTSTIKRAIVRNCTFINSPYSDGIYSRYCEQFAFYNNLFIRSSTPMSIDCHTGFHYPVGQPEDTCNSKGGIIAYNTIIENGTQSIYFNNGTNQVKFVNNIYYNTNAGEFFGRFDAPNNPIYRHQLDYNFYYATNRTFAGANTSRTTWGSSSYWFSSFVLLQEQHTTVNIAPTFMNLAGDDYRPLNSSSPQKNKGIPITTANGFFMNITTDMLGNPRSLTTPTCGAIE